MIEDSYISKLSTINFSLLIFQIFSKALHFCDIDGSWMNDVRTYIMYLFFPL